MVDHVLRAPSSIFTMVSPEIPEAHFELHPQDKKIFVVWKATGQADPIFNHAAPDERTARMIVDVWITGYKAGKAREIARADFQPRNG